MSNDGFLGTWREVSKSQKMHGMTEEELAAYRDEILEMTNDDKEDYQAELEKAVMAYFPDPAELISLITDLFGVLCRISPTDAKECIDDHRKMLMSIVIHKIFGHLDPDQIMVLSAKK